MARNVMNFNNSDLITHAMGGKMMIVRDGAEFSLVVENEVVYSNSTLDGLVGFLNRTAKRGSSSIMPLDCVKHATVLVKKLAMTK